MPPSIDELLALLDLEDDRGRAVYRGRQPDTSLQRVFGGQVASQALVAASRTVDAGPRACTPCTPTSCARATPRSPSSTTSSAPGTAGRSAPGGSSPASTADGPPIFYMSASFQVPEEGLDHQDPMPEVAPPEDCPELGDVLGRLTARPRDDVGPRVGRPRRPVRRRLRGRCAADRRRRHPAQSRVWLQGRPGRSATTRRCTPPCWPTPRDLTLLSASVLPHGTLHRRPAAAARIPGPRDVVPPAAARRPVAALRPGLAVRVRRTRVRDRATSSPPTAGWSPRPSRRAWSGCARDRCDPASREAQDLDSAIRVGLRPSRC